MKGSRAKKAAEAEGGDAAPAALEPTPPAEAREGGARPGPLVKASDERVRIASEEFEKLIKQLRTSELLGAAAADAFEAAAGLRPVATPQSKGAKDLRNEVADSRENSPDAKPKKKAGMFAEEVEEVPDLPEVEVAEGGADEEEEAPAPEREEPPELNLNPKQNKKRTDLEMWIMDEIPPLFGVDDSEELAEVLQEDGQADTITFLIAEADEAKQVEILDKWLAENSAAGGAPPGTDDKPKEEFCEELFVKVREIQALGPKKKKKKKKKAEADE